MLLCEDRRTIALCRRTWTAIAAILLPLSALSLWAISHIGPVTTAFPGTLRDPVASIVIIAAILLPALEAHAACCAAESPSDQKASLWAVPRQRAMGRRLHIVR